VPISSDKVPRPFPAGTALPKVCPFLRHPFPDCYCLNISGAKIPRIIEYCNGSFTSCQVFCRAAPQYEPAQEQEQQQEQRTLK